MNKIAVITYRSYNMVESDCYVRFVGNTFKLPYLEIGLLPDMGLTVYLHSNSKEQFDILTQFRPNLTKAQQEGDGIFADPPWAFLVSNGQDELSVRPNSGAIFVNMNCKTSGMEVSQKISERSAKELAASLVKAVEHGKVKREQTVNFKPLDCGYTYKVKRLTVEFEQYF